MLGMLLVNFSSGKPIYPAILKHSNDYCSYADTIMPQFLFAAGFAMRLSLGKRFDAGGKMPWGRAVRRILGLALVAIVWYSICDLNGIIDRFKRLPTGEFAKPLGVSLFELFKRDFFQTLLHIAATSLWILPVIAASSKVRVWFMIASGSIHLFLSWWFNFDWVNSDPTGIDGGPLGFFSWAVPALCGTLACDAVRSTGPVAGTRDTTRAARRIAIYGLAVAAFGWFMSIPTVLYNAHSDRTSADGSSTVIQPAGNPDGTGTTPKPMVKPRNEKFAPDPVIPSMARIRAWDGTLVEPPFVRPPGPELRKWNYWMMSQRSGNLSYLTFAAGISLVVYAFFLWACDIKGWRLGLFRTLGTNSLAAFLLHDVASWLVEPFFPKQGTILTASGAQWIQLHSGFDPDRSLFLMRVAETSIGFLCFALFVYGICRLLEWLGWYLRV